VFAANGSAERLREVRDDRRHQLSPFWKRECEVVRQRGTYAANAVGKLNKVARGQNAFFQEIKHECIDRGAYRLHCVEGERIAIALIGMEDAERGIETGC
jgi:hypothetical protein